MADSQDSYDDILHVAKDLLENQQGEAKDGKVSSEQIATRTGLDRLEIEQALKHLFEQDRLTATFFPDKPAEVSEVG